MFGLYYKKLHCARVEQKKFKKCCAMLLTVVLHSATIEKSKEVKHLINSGKIKGRMVEMGITQKEMADYLRLAAPTVSQKINNVRPMDLTEAEKIAEMLKIPDNEFGEYFFYSEVAQCNR